MNVISWFCLIFSLKSVFGTLPVVSNIFGILDGLVPVNVDTMPVPNPRFNVENVVLLDHYKADKSQISMSGFSSGAGMTTQYGIAYSKDIMGVGLIAGPHWGCAHGLGFPVGFSYCLQSPTWNSNYNPITEIDELAAHGYIDDTAYLAGDKVFILHPQRDGVINPETADIIENYYNHYGSIVKNVKSVNGQHGMITENYGSPCAVIDYRYRGLLDCDYNAAYHMLNFIYGNLTYPPQDYKPTGEYITFNQSEFIDGPPAELSFDEIGFAFVPQFCKTNPGCRLHLANHGCLAGRTTIGLHFVEFAGYNEVADLNNIIICYIQMIMKTNLPQLYNVAGCHDWLGYTTKNYTHKDAPQMIMFHDVIERIAS